MSNHLGVEQQEVADTPERKSAAQQAYDALHNPGVERLLADVEATASAFASSEPGWRNMLDEMKEKQHMPSGQETRVVDPTTGAAKGSKLARFDLLPWDALSALAEHYGRGTWKYADRNWEGGYAWSLSFAALQRHLIAHWQGEVYDLDPYLYGVDDAGNPTMTPEEIAALPDSEKVLHITAVMWHAAALAAFFIRGIGTDDRPV